MMKIVLIRHSKTFVEPEKPIVLWGLSEDGIIKAEDLSRNIIFKEVEVIYSSFQTKALETAIYLAKPNGIPIKADNSFTEISSFTKKFITDQKEYEKSVRAFYTNAIDRISEGETHQEALERFNKTLGKIVVDESREGLSTIAVVSHGNILSYFSAQYSEENPYDLHKKITMPDIAILDWNSKNFITFWGEV